MSPDAGTIAAYEANVAAYAARFDVAAPGQDLRAFMDLLPAGGRILDLGCGPGTASAFLKAAGFRPDPVDAAPAMVALANERHGLGARLGTFDDVAGDGVYEGVWASFSLLHAPRGDLPRHLAAIRRALVPGGVLHIAMKLGSGAARDRLGRFYSYYGRAELTGLLATAGFALLAERQGQEVGLAGVAEPFVVMLARG
jgi:SAM-dependent methyltransferase